MENFPIYSRWRQTRPRWPHHRNTCHARHTPDAISLLDRANGLLFTGDTYYPAPIWLYRPETDFDAYASSIQRLAALAPQIKLVLGAHNIPVAPPSVLLTLVDAFAQVRAGKGSCTPPKSGPNCVYRLWHLFSSPGQASGSTLALTEDRMFRRHLASLVIACLLLLAVPSPSGWANPPRGKTVWNYDGGISQATEGEIPDGPCFRLGVHLTADNFFENLRREDSTSGTLYRRGNDIVTEFPELMHLKLFVYDWPCADSLQQTGTRLYLTRAMISSMRVNFSWKRGMDLRPAREIKLTNAEAHKILPYAFELAKDLPERYEWLFDFDVPSKGQPLTDSLVIIFTNASGRIIARVAARL